MWEGIKGILESFIGNGWRFAALIVLAVVAIIFIIYRYGKSKEEKAPAKPPATATPSNPTPTKSEPTPKESTPAPGSTNFTVNVNDSGKVGKIVQGNNVNEK